MRGVSAGFSFAFRRALRDPALLVVLIAGVLLLALAPAGTAFGFHEQEGLVREVGLSTLLLGGIAVAMAAGGAWEGGAAGRMAAFRAAGRGGLYVGGLGGVLACAALAHAVLAACAFCLLRHREIAFADHGAFVLAGAVLAGGLLWGAWRNFRHGRSFPASSVCAMGVLGLAAACTAAWWSPEGVLRAAPAPEDILLLQTELMCLTASVAVCAAVWAGGAVCGRAAGVALGCAVVVLGQIKGHVVALPPVLGLPARWLLPNLELAWGGDYFYGDLPVLPWGYVVAAGAALLWWALAVAAAGYAVLIAVPDAAGLRAAGSRE